MKTLFAAAAIGGLALSLAACSKPADQKTTNDIGPQDSAVGQAMPDTSAVPADNALQTAPDAGATGTIPADGSTPPAAASSLPGQSATTPPTQAAPPTK